MYGFNYFWCVFFFSILTFYVTCFNFKVHICMVLTTFRCIFSILTFYVTSFNFYVHICMILTTFRWFLPSILNFYVTCFNFNVYKCKVLNSFKLFYLLAKWSYIAFLYGLLFIQFMYYYVFRKCIWICCMKQ